MEQTTTHASTVDQIRHLLAGVCLLAACGGDGGSGPAATLTADQVAGAWTFVLSDESAHCGGAAGGGPISVRLSGTSDDVIGDVLNFPADDWGGSPATTFGQVTGHINLATGRLDLRVWKGVLVNGAALEGRVRSDRTFTGTLTDPRPGFGPVFVTGSCRFTVTGSHD
jgi:autotransporter translocation and assembly factor TamB